MEASGGAHHWARKLQTFGHTVQLMTPQFVKPYVKSNKNDAADAEAICQAVGRPRCGSCDQQTVHGHRYSAQSRSEVGTEDYAAA